MKNCIKVRKKVLQRFIFMYTEVCLTSDEGKENGNI